MTTALGFAVGVALVFAGLCTGLLIGTWRQRQPPAACPRLETMRIQEPPVVVPITKDQQRGLDNRYMLFQVAETIGALPDELATRMSQEDLDEWVAYFTWREKAWERKYARARAEAANRLKAKSAP